MRRLYLSVPALVLLLSACSSDATDSTPTTGQTSPDPTVSIVEDPDGAGSGTAHNGADGGNHSTPSKACVHQRQQLWILHQALKFEALLQHPLQLVAVVGSHRA